MRYPEFTSHFFSPGFGNGVTEREEDQVDNPGDGGGEHCLKDSQDTAGQQAVVKRAQSLGNIVPIDSDFSLSIISSRLSDALSCFGRRRY